MSTSLQTYAPAPIAQADNDGQLIDLWLRTKRSEKTRKEYRRDVGRFWEYQRYASFAEAKLVDLQNYQDHLAASGLAVNSQRRALNAIKSIFSFAKKIGYLQFDVAAAITLPKAKNTLAERILSEAEVMKMIVLEPMPRNQLLIRLLYASAGRVSECVTLRWRDLQATEKGGVAILYGKGQKTRVVALPAKLFAGLQAGRGEENHYVFPSRVNGVHRKGSHLTATQTFRIVRQAAKRAGIAGRVSPHWLRHAHASHALANGANIKLVQETLGHESLAVTSAYTHARPEDSSALYLKIE